MEVTKYYWGEGDFILECAIGINSSEIVEVWGLITSDKANYINFL